MWCCTRRTTEAKLRACWAAPGKQRLTRTTLNACGAGIWSAGEAQFSIAEGALLDKPAVAPARELFGFEVVFDGLGAALDVEGEVAFVVVFGGEGFHHFVL